MTACSFGLRDSKSSATRGRPPVMSLVFVVSRGIRAMMSPASMRSPSDTAIVEPTGKKYRASFSPLGILSVLPWSSLSEMRGRSSASFDSVMLLRDRPVISSSCSVMVTPSMTSPNFTTPETSVRIGTEKGSHSDRSWPCLTASPSPKNSLAP